MINSKVRNSKLVSKNGSTPFVPVYLQYKEIAESEAAQVFPTDLKSAFLSSYFQDSYDFPYNPDPLASGNNYSIYDEMKYDDQIRAVMSFKKDLVIAPGWQIKCEKKEIVEALKKNLSETLEGDSFLDSLRNILSVFDYGFSLTDIIYRKPKDSESGKFEIKAFKTRPPHTFEFHLDKIGNVQKIVQHQSDKIAEFKPDYFLHHVYQPEFGNPYGTSDLRAAHLPWKAKKFIHKFHAIYLERFAAPTVVGLYPESFDQNKVTEFHNQLKTIQNSTVLAMPEGANIDFKLANRDSSGSYEQAIHLYNMMMARAILMPDLLGMSGERASGGSYALGETQFKIFMDIIKKEQNTLANKITLKVIRPLVKANWGDIPCEFEFKAFDSQNQLELMRVWLDAVKGRLWKATDDEINHLREVVKFPIGPIEREEFSPASPFGTKQPPSGEDPKTSNERKKSPSPEENEKKEKGSDEGDRVFIFRNPTKYEGKLNFAELKEAMETAEQRVKPKLKGAARDVYEDFIEQIKDKKILTRFRPDLINELKVRFQKPLNQEFKTYFRSWYIESYNAAQQEMFPMAEKKFALTEELLPEEFLDVLDAESFKMVGDYSSHITKHIKNKLTEGIKLGLNERELAKELKEFGAEETDKWLKTVIRTKTTEIYNAARKSYWDNDETASQIVQAYQFSAIMDDRTSEICQELDKQIFEKDEFANRINPPLHFNCRSILVPITKFEDYKSDENYVPPSKEPDLEDLKGLGGNLILAAANKVKIFFRDGQHLTASGKLISFGDSEVISSPGKDRSIQIIYLQCTNVSTRDTVALGFRGSVETENRYPVTLKAGENWSQSFDGNKIWILQSNSGFLVNKTTESPVEYTVEYIILDKRGKRIG